MSRPLTASAVEPLAAGATVFALGMRQTLHSGVTPGYVLAAIALPLWIGLLRTYRAARLVALAGVATAASALLLSALAWPTHAVDRAGRIGFLVLLLGTLLGAAAVLWARRLMSVSSVGLCYGAGMLVHAVLYPSATAGNPWKFVWAVPVAVVVLAFAHGRPRAEIGCLVLLAVASIAFDSRSYFATFVLTALIALWQRRSRAGSGRRSWVRTVGLMAALVGAVYYLGSTLLVDGYLGKAAQARSIEQIQTSGSLIVGGRPELLATVALMKHRPTGYGAGVVPTPQDILVAKSGMNSINYAPNNGYVEKYMFGGHIELHSMFGDLWASGGLAGLAFVAILVGVVIRGLAERIVRRRASGLVVFLAIWTLWNVAFSPLLSAAPTLLLALGLVLRTRTGPSVATAVTDRPDSGRPQQHAHAADDLEARASSAVRLQ